MIFKELLIKSCNCFILCHCFFLDIGDGWAPAVLNSQREADFIGQEGQTGTEFPYFFLLGGSTTGPNHFRFTELIHYRTGNTGDFIAIKDPPPKFILS